MTFDKLKPGIILYDVHSYTMGNTSIRSMGVWCVKVHEVHPNRTILASWNGNAVKRMYESEWKRLRLKEPELIRTTFGAYKLKPREAK